MQVADAKSSDGLRGAVRRYRRAFDSDAKSQIERQTDTKSSLMERVSPEGGRVLNLATSADSDAESRNNTVADTKSSQTGKIRLEATRNLDFAERDTLD